MNTFKEWFWPQESHHISGLCGDQVWFPMPAELTIVVALWLIDLTRVLLLKHEPNINGKLSRRHH